MKFTAAGAALSGILAGFVLAVAVHGQDPVRIETPSVESKLLFSGPLKQCPGKRLTVGTGTFEPEAETPLHRHAGTEILYVLEGGGEMHIEGKGSGQLIPGIAWLVEPQEGEESFVHQAVNLSSTEARKTFLVLIHDEVTPTSSPVDQETR